MNEPNPLKAGSAGVAGSDPSEFARPDGCAELLVLLEILPRLQAAADELDIVDADLDVPRTLLAGVIDDLEASL